MVCSMYLVGATICVALVAAQAQISIEGNCGSGITCIGSSFGECCSEHGWCGNSGDYCEEGCQSQWGICNRPSQGTGVVYVTHTVTETYTDIETSTVPVYSTSYLTRLITDRTKVVETIKLNLTSTVETTATTNVTRTEITTKTATDTATITDTTTNTRMITSVSSVLVTHIDTVLLTATTTWIDVRNTTVTSTALETQITTDTEIYTATLNVTVTDTSKITDHETSTATTTSILTQTVVETVSVPSTGPASTVTSFVTTTATAVITMVPAPGATIPQYGQCGGAGGIYTDTGSCVPPYTCSAINDYCASSFPSFQCSAPITSCLCLEGGASSFRLVDIYDCLLIFSQTLSVCHEFGISESIRNDVSMLAGYESSI